MEVTDEMLEAGMQEWVAAGESRLREILIAALSAASHLVCNCPDCKRADHEPLTGKPETLRRVIAPAQLEGQVTIEEAIKEAGITEPGMTMTEPGMTTVVEMKCPACDGVGIYRATVAVSTTPAIKFPPGAINVKDDQ